METFRARVSRQPMMAGLLSVVFVVLIGAACGSSASSDGATAATANDTTATGQTAADGDQSPLPDGGAADGVEAPSSTATDRAEREQSDIADDATATTEVDDADQDNTDQDIAAQDGDSSAGAATPRASDTGGSSSSTKVAAIETVRSLFACPTGSQGEPSESKPSCTAEQGESLRPVQTSQLVCPDGMEPVGGSGRCAAPVAPEDSVWYSCPLPVTINESMRQSADENGNMTCVRAIKSQYQIGPDDVSCDADERLEQLFGDPDFPYACYGTREESVPAIMVSEDLSCPNGWTVSGDTCELTESVPATVTTTAQCPRGSQLTTTLRKTICTWPNGDTTDPETKLVASCPAGHPLKVDGVVTTCVVTNRQPADGIVTYACPGDAVESGQDTNGRPDCVLTETTFRRADGSECEATYTQWSDMCSRTDQEIPVDAERHNCPAGTIASYGEQSGSVCEDVATVAGSHEVQYSCPAGADAAGAGQGMTCTARRSGSVDAIETTVVDYTCPAGSSGSPSQADPWCQKLT